ncbi:MAG: DUF1800 domain-containing protein [Chromatiales bacterium]|nr:DUF1800 domain-containing protein [Chromatiales bacterium]
MTEKITPKKTEHAEPTSRRKFLFAALAGVGASIAHTTTSAKERPPTDRSSRPRPVFEKWRPQIAAKAATTAQPPFAAVVLNRMGFGPSKNDIAEFNALGVTDDARLTAYVDQQLNWQSINDSVLDARIAAGTAPASDQPGYKTLSKTQQQQWADHHVSGSNRDGPLEDMERVAFVRATYSKRQLLEFLADFWHNHFNIYGHSFYAQSVFVSWDRDVLRPPISGFPRPAGLEHGHILGNFRQLLELSAKHPSMLYYLDNYVNNRGNPNENYAREIIELHTLGAINYAGPNPAPGEINTLTTPDFPSGINDKYSDADVYEAMRFFTGWKVSDGSVGEPDTGDWYFHNLWHDDGQKQFMGQNWGAFTGISEVYDLLDILAYHPGTAKYIALKLCRRFISDNPSDTFVDQIAQVFYDNRYESDQLSRVYRALLLSNEFKDTSTWGEKMKRPFETVVSAMRSCDANFTIRPGDSESSSFMYRMERSGQLPFHWIPPDGFPDERSFWEGGASLINTWRTLDWLLDENDGTPDALMPILQITQNELTANLHTPNGLASFWLERILGWEPTGGWQGTERHTQLRDFMRLRPDNDPSQWPVDYPIEVFADNLQDPEVSVNSWPHYWHDRLRAMVLLIFASPEFMQR